MESLGFLSVILTALLLQNADAKYIKSYTMPSLDCSNAIREIDGAVVYSANKLHKGVEQNTKCELRFTNADGTLLTKKRLALRFEQVDLQDCHVHLMVYAGRSSNARLLHKLTCNSTLPKEIFEAGEAATIVLDTGNADPKHYHFRILVTSYEKTGFCDELNCDNGRCISKDLACDSFDSCFDGSDESRGQPSYCKGAAGGGATIHQYVIPFEMWLIGLIIIIIILIICIIICIICCIRRSKGRDAFGRPTSTGTTSGGYQELHDKGGKGGKDGGQGPGGPGAHGPGYQQAGKNPQVYGDDTPSVPEYAPY